jgi:hypothetical protein
MNLLTSWKDSLSIFYSWQSFKSLCVAIGKELLIAIPSFSKRFWWLMLVLVMIHVRQKLLRGDAVMGAALVSDPVVLGIVGFLFIAASYPRWRTKSVERSYYGWSLIWYMGLDFAGVLLLGNIIFWVFLLSFVSPLLPPILWTFLILLLFSVMTVLPLMSLFFNDSRKTLADFFRSLGKSFSMILFNVPAWIIFVLPLLFIGFIFENNLVIDPLLKYLVLQIGVLVGCCLYLLVYTCFWSVIYTKSVPK